jgi:hypothetical protein
MAIKINKKIIFSLIIILLLIGGGVFWWQKNRETPVEKWEAAKVSPAEDYVVKETPEGKIVENEKVGLSYEIPKDWILENGNPTRFYSPDSKFREYEGKKSIFLEKGCRIEIYTNYIKTDLDTLKKFFDTDIAKLSPIVKIDESSRIKVSNYSALKHTYHIEKFGMSYISVDFPSKNKLYKIVVFGPIEEKERCEEEFNKFLETVSVK